MRLGSITRSSGIFALLFWTLWSIAQQPTQAPIHVVVDNYFGHEIADPYRYMEQGTPEASAWIAEQRAYTEAVLGAMPERNRFREHLRDLDEQMGPKYQWISHLPGDRYLYAKSSAKDDVFKLYLRHGIDGPERLLVDPQTYQGPGDGVASLEAAYQCPYNNLIAFAISIGNSERAALHIMDMESGKEVDKPIKNVLKWAEIDWSEDGRSFFYRRLPALKPGAAEGDRYLNSAVYLHLVGTLAESDRLIAGPGGAASLEVSPTQWPDIAMPIGSNWAVAVISDGVRNERELYIAPKSAALSGSAKWRKIATFDDGVTDFAVHGNELYVITSKNAPRGRVVRLTLPDGDFSKEQEPLIDSAVTPTGLGVAKDSLYVTARQGMEGRLFRISYATGKAEDVPLPEEGIPAIYSADPRLDSALFTVRGWTSAPRVYRYSGRKVLDTRLRPLSTAEQHASLSVTRLEVSGHDGVKVPLTLIHRRTLQKDGQNKILLLGYGSYGASYEPEFDSFMLAWYELGGAIAIAHVRGGGEYGEEWHQAGTKATKPNTWLDFISCAEYLVKQKYTRPQLLAGGAVSAGGILIGRAITERPDLFAAAWIGAGTTDMIRGEFQKNGPVNIPEFGTVKSANDFPWLLEMSAYHHVKNGTEYPAVLLTTGLNDPVVDPWQPAKMAARLRAATASQKPVLLRVDDGGHDRWGSTRSQVYALRADELTFLMWQLGNSKAKTGPR